MTTEDVLEKLKRTKDYLAGNSYCSYAHFSNVSDAVDLIQDLVAKHNATHNPEIVKEVNLLRELARHNGLYSEMGSLLSMAANRLEAMNPPAPVKPLDEVWAELYDAYWAARKAGMADEANRAKLEAAIKILAG